MMKVVRWLCYLGFATGALLVWALFVFGVLGVVPFAEPECALKAAGCPPPSVWKHLLTIIVVFGAIPLTTLMFVFFRRWVRRMMGAEDRL